MPIEPRLGSWKIDQPLQSHPVWAALRKIRELPLVDHAGQFGEDFRVDRGDLAAHQLRQAIVQPARIPNRRRQKAE
jgi:hypothetical protein